MEPVLQEPVLSAVLGGGEPVYGAAAHAGQETEYKVRESVPGKP